jgi:hypothetical protein
LQSPTQSYVPIGKPASSVCRRPTGQSRAYAHMTRQRSSRKWKEPKRAVYPTSVCSTNVLHAATHKQGKAQPHNQIAVGDCAEKITVQVSNEQSICKRCFAVRIFRTSSISISRYLIHTRVSQDLDHCIDTPARRCSLYCLSWRRLRLHALHRFFAAGASSVPVRINMEMHLEGYNAERRQVPP